MVKPPMSDGPQLSACMLPDDASSPLAAAQSSLDMGSGLSRNWLAAYAPPAAPAPEDPMPLHGRMPFLMIMLSPKSALPISSTLAAATDAVFLVCSMVTRESTDALHLLHPHPLLAGPLGLYDVERVLQGYAEDIVPRA